jgi:hypothetical protein
MPVLRMVDARGAHCRPTSTVMAGPEADCDCPGSAFCCSERDPPLPLAPPELCTKRGRAFTAEKKIHAINCSGGDCATATRLCTHRPTAAAGPSATLGSAGRRRRRYRQGLWRLHRAGLGCTRPRLTHRWCWPSGRGGRMASHTHVHPRQRLLCTAEQSAPCLLGRRGAGRRCDGEWTNHVSVPVTGHP